MIMSVGSEPKTVLIRKGWSKMSQKRNYNTVPRSPGEILRDSRGLGTIEIVLIILVLIGLVVIFKDQITGLVETLLSKVVSQSGAI